MHKAIVIIVLMWLTLPVLGQKKTKVKVPTDTAQVISGTSKPSDSLALVAEAKADSVYEVRLNKELNAFITQYLAELLKQEQVDFYKSLTPQKTIIQFWNWRGELKKKPAK